MADSIVVSKPNFACRRIFNNDQIIERFDKWLLICGKAANTRIAYTFTARQFAKFLDKPLTAATKEDVRAFLFELYTKGWRRRPFNRDWTPCACYLTVFSWAARYALLFRVFSPDASCQSDCRLQSPRMKSKN